MSIKVGVVTRNKSTTGSVQLRIVGDHNGVESPENEKVAYGSQGDAMAQNGIGTHNNWQPGTRVLAHEFAPDGSYAVLGSFPRSGQRQGEGDSKNGIDYKKADTPITFKNPGFDGPNTDNEMDAPSGHHNKYTGGQPFDASSYEYPGTAPYKNV